MCTHLVNVPDVDAVCVCSMLQDELLQVEEGALVGHVLPNLQQPNGDLLNIKSN